MKSEFEIQVGGYSKQEVLKLLENREIYLNQYAMEMIEHPGFRFSLVPYAMRIQLITLDELGCEIPVTLPRIYQLAQSRGLALCPAESAVFLRMAMMDQDRSTEPALSGTHQAPQGAVTIAMERLEKRDDFPRGLYLRNFNGQLWLRGYRCDDEYLWKGSDVFAFAVSGNGH